MPGARPRLLLLGATFNTANMGVGALAFGALKVLLHEYPDAAVSFLDYARQPSRELVSIEGKRVPVSLVNLRYSWKVFLPNNIAHLLVVAALARCLRATAGKALIERNSWLRQIAQADRAFALAGGDSFSDIYGLGRFLYVALPQLLVLAVGKPVVMLPQSIGPFKWRVSKAFAVFLMRRSARIYCRERDGVPAVRSWLRLPREQQKVLFSYDLGFVIEAKKPAAVRAQVHTTRRHDHRPLVGLNVSGLLLMGGYGRSNAFRFKVSYVDLIARIVRAFIEERSADVVLIPHVFGNAPESDVAAARALYERWSPDYGDDLSLVAGEYDQNEIKYVIGRCNFFVGSRMHACIAALSQAVPTVAIAYSAKFQGVLDSVGVNAVLDPRVMSIDEMVIRVGDAFSQRAALRTALLKTMPAVERDVLHMLRPHRPLEYERQPDAVGPGSV
jgi:polysaccharide pyruvyl transferase WcaK-like protein